jgi:hypothetical protein
MSFIVDAIADTSKIGEERCDFAQAAPRSSALILPFVLIEPTSAAGDTQGEILNALLTRHFVTKLRLIMREIDALLWRTAHPTSADVP